MNTSISLSAARETLWRHFQPRPAVRRPLADAMGLVCASDLLSDIDFPPFDRMAMDGYALHAADSAGATEEAPRRLRVVGAAYAGAPFEGTVQLGECVRAMTGAELPRGADCVLPVEWTQGYDEHEAVLLREVEAAANIASRGQDLRAGDCFLAAGTRIGTQHIQALASAGHVEIDVIDAPRTAVLSTGDELVDASVRPRPGQIRESNSHSVAALFARWAIPCERLAAASDTRGQLLGELATALDHYDLLVISGGVSMGERDHVKSCLRELGVELHFESIQMRPGHPTTFGSRGATAVFALPGNPVAVVAALEGLFRVGLRRMMGLAAPMPATAWAQLGFDFQRKGSREQLLPIRLSEQGAGELPLALATNHHGSGDFVSLAAADAFAFMGGAGARFESGQRVPILALGADL